jgi:hypothetical protein
MSVDKSARSKAIDSDSQTNHVKEDSETNDSSSSTDTQILLLNRTPRGLPAATQRSEVETEEVKTQADIEHDTDTEEVEEESHTEVNNSS